VAGERIVDTPEWKALEAHRAAIDDLHLRDLFAADPERAERFSAEAGDLYLDYSKNRMTGETLELLVALAERAELGDRIEAMFSGERINVTEDRPVLHVALRAPEDASIVVDGTDVVPLVHSTLTAMGRFSHRVRSG
jgi:glucose-6-phosphate isomerase